MYEGWCPVTKLSQKAKFIFFLNSDATFGSLTERRASRYQRGDTDSAASPCQGTLTVQVYAARLII